MNSHCKGTNKFDTMQAFIRLEAPSMKLYELIYGHDNRGLNLTTTMTTKTTFTGDRHVAIGSSAARKKVVKVVKVVVY